MFISKHLMLLAISLPCSIDLPLVVLDSPILAFLRGTIILVCEGFGIDY
jgi:hypothetical protein